MGEDGIVSSGQNRIITDEWYPQPCNRRKNIKGLSWTTYGTYFRYESYTHKFPNSLIVYPRRSPFQS